jgi:hypothetical protein
MSNVPWTDPIIEEVRCARGEYAAQFNYNLEAIHRDLKEREARGEFTTVRRPSRPPEPTTRTGT